MGPEIPIVAPKSNVIVVSMFISIPSFPTEAPKTVKAKP